MKDTPASPETDQRSPHDLRPVKGSPRLVPERQLEAARSLIEQFGFYKPVVVDENGQVIVGWPMVAAAQGLGLNGVPVVPAEGLSEEQVRALAIADEKLGELGEWNDELLRIELTDLEELGFDPLSLGFSREELDELFLDTDGLEEEGHTEDDDLPLFGEWHTSRLGDVWICGDHRVMCGDSTVITDVEALVGEELLDMCWTDPPYNVDYKGAAGKIENDNQAPEAFLEFLSDALGCVAMVMKDGAAIYISHADIEGLAFRTAFEAAGFKLSGCLVWVKPSLVLGRSDYQWRHEPILYGWKPGAAHRWYGGRKQTTVVGAEDVPFTLAADGAVLIDTGTGHIRITGTDMQVEEIKSSVLFHEKPAKSAEHPTMKPVGLGIEYLKNSSRRGDCILDPFGGSGTTLIAAQKIGRKARLLELDPRFADVIVRRWQDFTSEKAFLASSGEAFDDLTDQRKAANSERD